MPAHPTMEAGEEKGEGRNVKEGRNERNGKDGGNGRNRREVEGAG